MVKLTKLRHSFPEPAGMKIDRKEGFGEYTFLHFHKSVELLSGGKVVETEPGAVIIYDIGTPQYFYSKIPLIHDWMHFTGDISEILEISGLSLDRIYYPAQGEFITAIIKEMETEFYSDGANSDILLSLKFRELFIKLGRAVTGGINPVFDKETRSKFRNFRSEMLSAADKKWSVAKMAKSVGFSESRFYSIYKSIYGISPAADLISARIDHAKNLLSFTDKKIEEIADILGYDNVTHFIRQFKKAVGMSPTAFRKKQGM